MASDIHTTLTPDADGFLPHTSHWGVFSARFRDGALDVRPYRGDPDPNRVIDNFPAALRHRARIAQPMVRRGWLERGPGPDRRRGRDEFVPMEWDAVLDLLAAELRRVEGSVGARGIFGGSYGWSSAGRFHHAQSQVHRFLNTAMGGYVRSVNSYSSGASSVLMPHIIGNYDDVVKRNVSWEQLAEHSEIVIAFGGMALKNSMVAGGGVSEHVERGAMARAAARGCRFVLVGPLQADLPAETGAEWVSLVPGTDTALILALIHTLVVEGRHDRDFLQRFTTGWPVFEPYLLGVTDGQPKDAAWAAPITGVDADAIRQFARDLSGKRALVTVAHSLQRAEHGEQPVWAAATLAAVLGQIGLPGGGFGYGLGAIAYYGRRAAAVPVPTLAQGRNGVADFIPVARISDMLLNPGGSYRYNGETRTYPEIKLVYWAGGNPFHHHQDLNRLRRAFAAIDTLVVHELGWTATARHADIVLPCTMTLEREDIGGNGHDPLLVAMHQVAEPYGQARDDYAIFADLARRLGAETAFTEGRTVRQWLEHLYEKTRRGLLDQGHPAPDFEAFWQAGSLPLPQREDDGGNLRRFRADPDANPLITPSGKIEIGVGDDRRVRRARLPGSPHLAAADRADIGRRSPPPRLQPARHPAAQPARFRRAQRGEQASRTRSRPHASGRRGRPRHRRWRHRPPVQRPRRLPGRHPADRPHPRRRHPAAHRRLVRPCRPGGRAGALRARQSQRADARHRHLRPGARLHRPAHDRRGRAVHRQSAADPGLRSALTRR